MVLVFIARPTMGVNSMNSYEILGFCNKEDHMNTLKKKWSCRTWCSRLHGVHFVLPQNIP